MKQGLMKSRRAEAISGRELLRRARACYVCVLGVITVWLGAERAHAALGFGSPAALNTNAASDSGIDFNTNVVTDGAGNWVAAWASDDSLGGTIGTDRDILVSRSTNNGATWTAPAALNTDAATDGGASDFAVALATDGAGVWVAAWRRGTSMVVSRSTNNGGTWSAPATVENTLSNHYPRLAAGGSGVWVLVWEAQNPDKDIYFSRSTDGGINWSTAAALNSNAASDSGDDEVPRLSNDGAGAWVATWFSNDTLGGTVGSDYDVFTSRSTDNGATWSTVAALNTNAGTDSGADVLPALENNGSGAWVAVWHSDDTLGGTLGSDNDILTARSTNGGASWTSPIALNTNATTDSGGDTSPKITRNAAGQWLVVWVSTDTLGGTIGSDEDLLGSVSIDNGVTWTAPEPANANAATDSGDDSDCGFPAVDGAGNWVLIWQSNDTLGGTIGTDFDVLFSTSVSVPVELSEFAVE